MVTPASTAFKPFQKYGFDTSLAKLSIDKLANYVLYLMLFLHSPPEKKSFRSKLTLPPGYSPTKTKSSDEKSKSQKVR